MGIDGAGALRAVGVEAQQPRDVHDRALCGFLVSCLLFLVSGCSGLGFGVWGLGFGVWGLRFGVSNFRFQISGFGTGCQYQIVNFCRYSIVNFANTAVASSSGRNRHLLPKCLSPKP